MRTFLIKASTTYTEQLKPTAFFVIRFSRRLQPGSEMPNKAVAPVLLGPNVFGIFSVFENQFYLNPNIANRLTRLVPGHY